MIGTVFWPFPPTICGAKQREGFGSLLTNYHFATHVFHLPATLQSVRVTPKFCVTVPRRALNKSQLSCSDTLSLQILFFSQSCFLPFLVWTKRALFLHRAMTRHPASHPPTSTTSSHITTTFGTTLTNCASAVSCAICVGCSTAASCMTNTDVTAEIGRTDAMFTAC